MMYRYEDVKLRTFEEQDIELKVKWINDIENNEFLHYELPLTVEKTKAWFERNKDKTDRWDATVLFEGKPVGLFGLLDIDYKNKTAQDYSLIGDLSTKGKGVGSKAGVLNICYAFYNLGLNKVWGTIEVGNIASLKRWRKMGGIIEGYLHDHICRDGKFYDAYYVSIFKDSFKIPEGVYTE